MNNVVFRLISLVSGGLFGAGMVLSGMANPAKVIGFLDVAGAWDPSLMFVMGGALAVFMPSYFLVIKPKHKPLIAREFCLAKSQRIDRRLLGGALIFGVGWGIAGICPGPVVASLGLGNAGAWLFFASMLGGLAITNYVICLTSGKEREAQTVR